MSQALEEIVNEYDEAIDAYVEQHERLLQGQAELDSIRHRIDYLIGVDGPAAQDEVMKARDKMRLMAIRNFDNRAKRDKAAAAVEKIRFRAQAEFGVKLCPMTLPGGNYL